MTTTPHISKLLSLFRDFKNINVCSMKAENVSGSLLQQTTKSILYLSTRALCSSIVSANRKKMRLSNWFCPFLFKSLSLSLFPFFPFLSLSLMISYIHNSPSFFQYLSFSFNSFSLFFASTHYFSLFSLFFSILSCVTYISHISPSFHLYVSLSLSLSLSYHKSVILFSISASP